MHDEFLHHISLLPIILWQCEKKLLILGGKLKLNFSQFFINFNSIFSFAKNSPPKSLERYILYFFESIFENKKTKKGNLSNSSLPRGNLFNDQVKNRKQELDIFVIIRFSILWSFFYIFYLTIWRKYLIFDTHFLFDDDEIFSKLYFFWIRLMVLNTGLFCQPNFWIMNRSSTEVFHFTAFT